MLTNGYRSIMMVFVLKNKCASGSAVEHHLAKVGVAGSIPVSRSEKPNRLITGGSVFSFLLKKCILLNVT